MNSIKFKAEIDDLPDIVKQVKDVAIEVNRLDDNRCLIELTPFKDDDEQNHIALMDSIANIASVVGSINMQFVY